MIHGYSSILHHPKSANIARREGSTNWTLTPVTTSWASASLHGMGESIGAALPSGSYVLNQLSTGWHVVCLALNRIHQQQICHAPCLSMSLCKGFRISQRTKQWSHHICCKPRSLSGSILQAMARCETQNITCGCGNMWEQQFVEPIQQIGKYMYVYIYI